MKISTNNKTAALSLAARDLIESFALQLAEVFKADARAQLLRVLELEAPPSSRRVAPSSRRHKPSAHAAPRAKGAKRDPAELERVTSRLLAYVKGHPGERIEQIATAIGAQARDLTLPMKKLMGSKTVKKKGERRSTKYFHAAAA